MIEFVPVYGVVLWNRWQHLSYGQLPGELAAEHLMLINVPTCIPIMMSPPEANQREGLSRRSKELHVECNKHTVGSQWHVVMHAEESLRRLGLPYFFASFI